MYETFYIGTKFIICRSCEEVSANDYHGFCSSVCCANYAIKHGLTILNSKHGCVHCETEESGYQSCTKADEIFDLECKLERFDEVKREELMDKDMERQKAVYEATKEWKKKYQNIKIENKELIEAVENLTKHSKRFQEMILDGYGNNE